MLRGGFFNRRNYSVFVNFHLDKCVTNNDIYISDVCLSDRFIMLYSKSHPLFVESNESVGFNLEIDLSCGDDLLPLGAYVCLLVAFECVDIDSCNNYSNQSILESQQILFQII